MNGSLTQADVVLLTKNSEYLLTKCLNSIYANVPVHQLIVVDGYSTDRTIEILEKFNQKHGNIKIIQEKGTRASARETGIQYVTTEYFAFIDSDVILCRGWFKKAFVEMQQGVGAVWGINIDVIPNVKQKWFLLLESMIARQGFCLRGGTHDTLIRKTALDGLHIPFELHAFEDAYLIRWIEKQGYKAVVGSNIYCLHYKPPTNWSPKNAVDQAIVEFKCGLLHSHMYAYALFYPVFMFYWLLQVPLSGFGGQIKR
ncbi:MAG: glycosyltransferase family A protein [Candidatus Bathyarchaeia archaeon]